MTGEHETTSPLTATHFPHDADIGVRGTGPTLAAAFEQAALAMIAVITDPAKVRLEETVAIECAAPNAELPQTRAMEAFMEISQLEKLSATAWQIPAHGAMRVPAIIYADE